MPSTPLVLNIWVSEFLLGGSSAGDQMIQSAKVSRGKPQPSRPQALSPHGTDWFEEGSSGALLSASSEKRKEGPGKNEKQA